MTDDFVLFSTPADDEPSVDPDMALITAYLARELSLVQIVALEERLATDATFRTKVAPLLDAWARPAPSGVPAARARDWILSPSQRAAGWKRHVRETESSVAPRRVESAETLLTLAGSASPTTQRRVTMPRIAAIIAFLFLPMFAFAQLVVYAAHHADAPGHAIAQRLAAPFDRPTTPAPLPPHDGGVSPMDQPSGRQMRPSPVQQSVPIVDLSSAIATTSQRLMGVIGLTEARDGSILVDDGVARQLLLFEPSLAKASVILDSISGSATSYGRIPRPLFSFRGDSSLIRDLGTEGVMLVLDERGRAARAMAIERASPIWTSPVFADGDGRLVFIATRFLNTRVVIPRVERTRPDGSPRSVGRGPGTTATTMDAIVTDRPDSLPLIRLDLEARRTDTVAYVTIPPYGSSNDPVNGGGKRVLVYGRNGATESVKQVINPLYLVDDWAVLSDGTIAIVRGQDYHVDWIRPDGTRSSSPKLPFEWKRLTDDDKRRLVDSTRSAVDSLDSLSLENDTRMVKGLPPTINPLRPRGPLEPPPPFALARQIPYEIVPLTQIADYYPPINRNAAKADADGNLWILPRSTSLSRKGELVYDVVNPSQGLVKRVRVPVGRSIVGFGRGGVVYLQSGDLAKGFVIERTKVPIR